MVQPNESQTGMFGAVGSLTIAIVVYVAICVPAYFWLQGPVGNAGTVDASVVIAALALGSIMLVPVIKSIVDKRSGQTGRFRMGGPWEGNE